MDKEQTDDNTTEPLYPEPTKGSLSEDHSQYGKPGQWAGGDPDKNLQKYFIAFMVIMGILFIMAVKSLSSGSFFF